jgi:HSP20 family molecular chaperone IbpA
MKEHFENEEDIDIDIDIDDEHGKPHKIIKRRFIDDESCCGESFPGSMGKHKVFIKKGGKGLHHGMHRMKKSMQMKILKEDDKTVMFLSVPGLDKNTLSVKAKKRAVLIEGSYLVDFHKSYGEKFSEKFRIPFTIDPDKIEAEYKTGILKLTFLGIEALDPAVDIDVTYAEE